MDTPEQIAKPKDAKATVLVITLLVTILPFLSGGREPVSLIISFFVIIIGLFLWWRWPGSTLQPPTLTSTSQKLAVWGGGAFIAWSVLSLTWSVNRFQTFVFTAQLIMLAAVFMLARSVLARTFHLKWWANGYLVIASLTAIVGFYFYFTANYYRLISTFYWPNPLATFLIPAVLLALYLCLTQIKSLRYSLIAALNLAAIILTVSKGAYIVLAICITILVLSLQRRRQTKLATKLLFVMTLTAAIALAAIGIRSLTHHIASVSDRVALQASAEPAGATDRLHYWQTGFEILATHRWLGTGGGTFGTVYPNYQTNPILATTNSHNFFVQSESELGVPGGFILCIAIFGLVIELWHRRQQPNLRWVMLLSTMAIIAHSLVDISLSYPAVLFLVASLAGGAFASPPTTSLESTSPQTPRRYSAIMVSLAMLLLAWPIISYYQTERAAQLGDQWQAAIEYERAAEFYAASDHGLVFNPDNLTRLGIEHYTLALEGDHRAKYLNLALSEARQAAQLDPSDAQHYLLQARVLVAQKQARPAIQAYEQAIALDPTNHPIYYSELGGLLIAAGRLQDAQYWLNHIAQLYPDSVIANRSALTNLPDQIATIHAHLAFLALQEHDLATAQAEINYALNLSPQNPAAGTIKLFVAAGDPDTNLKP